MRQASAGLWKERHSRAEWLTEDGSELHNENNNTKNGIVSLVVDRSHRVRDMYAEHTGYSQRRYLWF